MFKVILGILLIFVNHVVAHSGSHHDEPSECVESLLGISIEVYKRTRFSTFQ